MGASGARACLAGGNRTVASFRTAARLWALAGFGGFDAVEITTLERVERVFLDLAQLGRRRSTAQHRVRVGARAYRLDLAYPDLLIGIEYDGWDPHRTRSAFDGDRARQNPLEIIGWLILRYTSRSTRQVVVQEVEQAISARMQRRT